MMPVSCLDKDNSLKNMNGGAFEGPCFKYTPKHGDSVESVAERYKADVKIMLELNPRLVHEPITNLKQILIPYIG